MGEQFETIGYHKTTQIRAGQILSWKSFVTSKKKTEWLGTGIYFWERLSDAEWWNANNYEHSSILSVNLICDRSQFLNLDHADEMRMLLDFASKTADYIKQNAEYDVDFSNQFQIRAVFCNYYKKAYGIKLMKFSFPDHFETNIAGFKCPVGRPQFCATDNDVIHNIKEISKATGKKNGGVKFV